MRTTAIVLALLAGLATSCSAVASEPQATVVYVVRHAEKQVGPDAPKDPALTEEGEARAERLATMLADVPLAGVYSTDTLRTRSTAAPTARGHGLQVTLYDPSDPAGLKRMLTEAGGHYLVVGHSNTVPGIVETFGSAPAEPIADGDYTRLYLLVVPPDQPLLTAELLHF